MFFGQLDFFGVKGFKLMEIKIAACFFQQESLDPPKEEWFNSVIRTGLSLGSPGVCLEIPAGLIPRANQPLREASPPGLVR